MITQKIPRTQYEKKSIEVNKIKEISTLVN